MKAWQFTTDTYPPAERQAAWREAMDRLHLPIGSIEASESDFHGTASCVVSPMGIEFALVSSGPQEIAGRYPQQEAAVWLTALIDGEAVIETDTQRIAMKAGAIAFGPTGAPAAMRLTTPFTQLFVKAPRVALNPRLLSPMAVRLGSMGNGTAAERIFFALLKSTAEAMNDLTTDQLRPVELSVTEFLITCLASEGGPIARGGLGGARAMHLHRICQTVETMLSDPNLTLERVAGEHGVSPRYLQKLFSSADDTFSHYVRARRLERCHADLTSPICAQLSISDICFRWGFNGSAHFSRAFREAYGVSPRDHRRSMGGGDQDSA